MAVYQRVYPLTSSNIPIKSLCLHTFTIFHGRIHLISPISSTLQGTSSATSPPRSARRWPSPLSQRRWWRSWRRSRRRRCAWCRGAAGLTYLELPRMAPREIGAGTHVFFTQTFCEIVGMESGKMWGYWQTWVNIIYIYTLYMHMYVYIYIYIHVCLYIYVQTRIFISHCFALHYITLHHIRSQHIKVHTCIRCCVTIDGKEWKGKLHQHFRIIGTVWNSGVFGKAPNTTTEQLCRRFCRLNMPVVYCQDWLYTRW